MLVGVLRWQWQPAVRPGEAGFNVLLITLDTTRADHLGCYGHPKSPTPHIDALARQGTMFTQCSSPAPITLPAHASLFTATDPYVHGVRDNGQFQLGESNLTLAEILKAAGYATGGHSAAYVVRREHGLAQGFDAYFGVRMEKERRGDEVCDQALEWLRANASRRFFAWVHFFDPHAPYEPPAPFRQQYDDPYVGEIAFADHQVGRLVQELQRLGLEEKTLVVVTADHGEGREEHGEENHLYFIYDTTMRVPLIFHCPGAIPAGRVVSAQARLIDATPTILAFLKLAPKPDAQGVSLLPLIAGEVEDLDLAAYGETLGGFLAMELSPLRSLREGGWKYIHAPRPELYHVAGDPGEATNLAESEPARLAKMRGQLTAMIAQAPPPAAFDESLRTVSGQDTRALQGLGYVGGGASAAKVKELLRREMELVNLAGPDPKDHKEAIRIQGQATHAMIEDRFVEAEGLLRRLAQVFPGSPGVDERLARALFMQGRNEEAIALYRQIIAAHPERGEPYYGIAKLLARAGQSEEAISFFRRAIAVEPDRAEAHYDLGVLLLKSGQPGQAKECFRRALQIRPTYGSAMVNLAVVAGYEGQHEDSVGLYRRAIELEPGDPTLHYNLGNALARLGDRHQAARQYEEALRLAPGFEAARAALAAVSKPVTGPAAGGP